jgi:hypothetical protein
VAFDGKVVVLSVGWCSRLKLVMVHGGETAVLWWLQSSDGLWPCGSGDFYFLFIYVHVAFGSGFQQNPATKLDCVMWWVLFGLGGAFLFILFIYLFI